MSDSRFHFRQRQAKRSTDSVDEAKGAFVRGGDLVCLRRHLPLHRERFVAWYGDPNIAELLRHDLEPLTITQARGYFESIVLPATARGTWWAICERATERLIGTTAVTDIDAEDNSCLFRIVIGESDLWGRGYGTEATSLVLAEAFEHLGVETFRLEVFAHNLRAQRAYDRVGFEITGRHTEWIQRRRRQLHVIEMAITRDRWAASSLHERTSELAGDSGHD